MWSIQYSKAGVSRDLSHLGVDAREISPISSSKTRDHQGCFLFFSKVPPPPHDLFPGLEKEYDHTFAFENGRLSFCIASGFDFLQVLFMARIRSEIYSFTDFIYLLSNE